MPDSPDVPRASHARRLAAVVQRCRDAGIDALLVTHPPNLRYLTGFDGTMGALIIGPGVRTLLVDGRYVTAAAALVEENADLHDLRVEHVPHSFEETTASLLLSTPEISRLGVEAAAVTVSRFERLRRALQTGRPGPPAVRLVPTERIVERSRLIKDASEIARFRAAAALLSAVAQGAISFVRPGRTELEIAAEVDAALRRAGFERPAFDTIVASGPNSARPHARPGGRQLEPGDGVVLDFGGVYGGYCVDLTRTVQLPPQTASYGRLFEAVRAAQAAAIACVRPGVKGSAVDAAAREVLAQHGLASAFLHGTGHGLGLEVHEEPRISSSVAADADETLQPGMIFTVEPGAYVPGLGGVRIEDNVLVIDEGCEVLTKVPIDRRGWGPDPAADPSVAGA